MSHQSQHLTLDSELIEKLKLLMKIKYLDL